MPNINTVIIAGHITRDIELKYANTGTAIANFGIAVNTGYKDKQETYFGEITVFGKTAEYVSKYAQKGSAAFIQGRLKTESWEDKNTGKKQSKTRIIAERVDLLTRTDKGETQEQAEPQKKSNYTKSDAPPELPTEDPFEVAEQPEDDIPF